MPCEGEPPFLDAVAHLKLPFRSITFQALTTEPCCRMHTSRKLSRVRALGWGLSPIASGSQTGQWKNPHQFDGGFNGKIIHKWCAIAVFDRMDPNGKFYSRISPGFIPNSEGDRKMWQQPMNAIADIAEPTPLPPRWNVWNRETARNLYLGWDMLRPIG